MPTERRRFNLRPVTGRPITTVADVRAFALTLHRRSRPYAMGGIFAATYLGLIARHGTSIQAILSERHLGWAAVALGAEWCVSLWMPLCGDTRVVPAKQRV